MKFLSKMLVSLLLVPASALATDEYTVELYDTYCKACHSVAGAGVPVAFKSSDWEKRIAKGFDQVVNNAINGVGNMPAQGSCQECVYQDFEDLVNYMSTAK
jgi:cytochrome c5